MRTEKSPAQTQVSATARRPGSLTSWPAEEHSWPF